MELEIEKDIPVDLETKFVQQQKHAGYIRGYKNWSFYKTNRDLYTLDQVLEWMKKVRSGENLELPQTIDANALINRHHWNLFQIQSERH